MSKKEVMNIIFAGVGGQGNILVSHLLADAALEKGYPVRLTETFGAATRGGSVFSCVRIGEAGAPLPREHAVQVMVGLEPLESLRRALTYLAPGGWVLVNTHPWIPVDVSTGRIEYPEIDQILDGLQRLGGKVISLDATRMAQDAGNSRMMNIVLLGGLMALGAIDIDNKAILAQMDKRWKKEIASANKVAFQQGFDHVRQTIQQAG
ncbi:MAG: indolepyruvate oxidoreductase subunit beta [Chloroflexi bacterium]|nr:indolepyruvate oxidoreductase subunit beta [Chloroflexota bacterium]